MKESTSNQLNAELRRRIHAYAEGRLNDEEIDRLWAELIRDPEALDYLKTVANLSGIARDRSKYSGASRRSGQAREPRRLYWAVAALIMIGGLFGLFYYSGTADQIEPVGQIELDYYRSGGQAGDLEEGERIVEEAIVMANRGNSSEALTLLDSALETAVDPAGRAVIYLNSGSIHYNRANYEEAALHFRNIIELNLDDDLMYERAYWYLGNTYFQLDRLEEAKEAFRQAYELNGAYRRIVERYLDQLPV